MVSSSYSDNNYSFVCLFAHSYMFVNELSILLVSLK